MKKIKNKQWIQNIIHYLIKWVDWFFKYNFYKSANHLASAFKAIADYKQKLKHKHKKISQINIDEILNSENASHKQMSRWDHMLYSVHDVLNETLKSHVFHFVYSKILIDFWMNYFILSQLLFLLLTAISLLSCRILLCKKWEMF